MVRIFVLSQNFSIANRYIQGASRGLRSLIWTGSYLVHALCREPGYHVG